MLDKIKNRFGKRMCQPIPDRRKLVLKQMVMYVLALSKLIQEMNNNNMSEAIHHEGRFFTFDQEVLVACDRNATCAGKSGKHNNSPTSTVTISNRI